MFSRLKFYFFGLFVMIFLACQTSSPLDNTPDTKPQVATSEITPDVIHPILLIDPIFNSGILEIPQVDISGHILANTNITIFTATLNSDNPTDLLAVLSENGDFVFTLNDLIEGTNIITIEVSDELNTITNLDLTITYTPPVETSGDSEGDDEAPNAVTPQDRLLGLILDILNAGQSQYQDFANFVQNFKANEEALTSILDFLSTWDGSDAALQTWWNDWANVGKVKMFPHQLFNQGQAHSNKPNTWQLEDIRIALNDIEHLSNILLPQIAENLNDIENTDEFIALQNQKDVLGCAFEWTVKITKIDSDLHFDAASVSQIEFLENNRVAITLNLDAAVMNSDFKLIANPPKDCIFKTSRRTGKIVAQNLAGKLVLQLGYDYAAKRLNIQNIVSSTLAVDSVTSSMDHSNNFWQSMAEWVFKRLYGCNFCSDSDAEIQLFQYIFDIEDNQPYKKMFNTALQEDDQVQNLLMAELNKIFMSSLQFNGNVATENTNQDFTYETEMVSLATNTANQQLISNWDLVVTANEPRDTCATHFKIPNLEFVATDIPKLGDFGIQLTYTHIANMLRGVARSGAFCFEDEITLNDFTLAQLSLQPYGTISIDKSTRRNSHLDITYPFEIEVQWGDENRTQPNFIFNTSANSNNKIYGEFLISVHFATSCDAGLTLSIDNTELLNLSGTLKINAYSFDLSPIEDELRDWLKNISYIQLQNIPITGQILTLEDLPSMSIQIKNDFVATESDISFGLEFVRNDNCR